MQQHMCKTRTWANAQRYLSTVNRCRCPRNANKFGYATLTRCPGHREAIAALGYPYFVWSHIFAPEFWSRIFQSRIFHPCIFVTHGPTVSVPAFQRSRTFVFTPIVTHWSWDKRKKNNNDNDDDDNNNNNNLQLPQHVVCKMKEATDVHRSLDA